MRKTTKVMSPLMEYSKEDLMEMEPELLRALLRERTHHNIEVALYPTLLKWQGKAINGFGGQAQLVYDVWRERGFTDDAPDIEWVKKYLALAEQVRRGERPQIDESLPTPFTDEEMAVVKKLIYRRYSVRDWIDKEVPDEMIEQILEAGRAAPIGCNLDEVRFIVIKDPEEAKMVWSDISTKNSVIIVVCHDTRIPKVVGQDFGAPQNAGFDAAAAADHMLLVAHALGLGAVWLTFAKGRKDTAEEFREKYGLPDYIEVDLHIAVGWSAMGTIKSARMPLEDMIIRRSVPKTGEG